MSHKNSNSTVSELSVSGDCYFIADSPDRSYIFQLINIKSFSVLIDSGHAACNVSVYISCTESGSNAAVIIISYYQVNNIFIKSFASKIMLILLYFILFYIF